MQKPPIPPVPSRPGYERISIALETVLASEKFQSAPQMSAFLRYVVLQTATGNQHRIKAYTVAVDALGKPSTFDPQNDPVVRVLAGRLRSTLHAYYEQQTDADVIIEMKPGSYVPSFRQRGVSDPASKPGPSDGSCNAPTVPYVVADSSANDDPMDAMSLSVDLSQAANRQWALFNPDSVLNSDYLGSDKADAEPARPQALPAQRESGMTILLRNLRRFPKMTSTAALLGAVLAGMYVNERMQSPEPDLLAVKPLQIMSSETGTLRPRPDGISLFVSAMAPEGSLASQINTTMSSVFSDSTRFRVHRMLRSPQIQHFWPEDYHLSLNVMPLEDETLVNIQLVDSQTGRITHSESLHLSADAHEGLSGEDLKMIQDCARRLISEDGPLTRDYKSKTESL